MGNHDKTVAGNRKSDHQLPGGSREKLIVMHASSLHRRRNLTTRLVTSAKQRHCPCSEPQTDSANYPEERFEFPFNLISKSTMAFLTGQSWRLLKSWYTGGDPEQGFWRCFAELSFVFGAC